jgi:hypothetical protein
LSVHLAGVNEAPAQPPGGPSLGGLRQAIRDAMRDEPALFVKPSFRAAGGTLSYSFGGVNLRFLDGPDGAPTALERLARTEAIVEMMRQSTASDANSRAYWGPILDQVEAQVARGLARLGEGPAAPEDVADVTAEADRLLTAGIERVAAQRSQRAVPVAEDVWAVPTDLVKQARIVTRTVPVTQTVKQVQTQYVTQFVPVTRTITEMVPQTKTAYSYTGKGQSTQTVMVPRTRTVTEMEKRQVPKQVVVDVPVTTNQERQVQVTETVSTPRKQCKVKVVTDPGGGKVYYLPRFMFYVVKGQGLPDEFPTWQAHWKAAEEDEAMTLGQSTYYFRALWGGNRHHRSQRDIDSDLDVKIEPDPQ